MPAPAERPYPYEILGLQPGDPLDDVLAVYAERSDAAPTSESGVLRIQSPDGAVFEFTYQLFSRIGDVGINGRLAGAAQDQVTARLPWDSISHMAEVRDGPDKQMHTLCHYPTACFAVGV